jgi:hypothetical protein
MAAIDTGALAQVVWVSLLCGVGVSATFSLVILGGTRAAEARRAGRGGAAVAYGALAVAAGLVFAGGIAVGLAVTLDK